jgi:hypothetical protein
VWCTSGLSPARLLGPQDPSQCICIPNSVFPPLIPEQSAIPHVRLVANEFRASTLITVITLPPRCGDTSTTLHSHCGLILQDSNVQRPSSHCSREANIELRTCNCRSDSNLYRTRSASGLSQPLHLHLYPTATYVKGRPRYTHIFRHTSWDRASNV